MFFLFLKHFCVRMCLCHTQVIDLCCCFVLLREEPSEFILFILTLIAANAFFFFLCLLFLEFVLQASDVLDYCVP